MAKTIKARYRRGVFEPLEPVRLEEDREVEVSIPETEEITEGEKVRRFEGAAEGWEDLIPESFLEDIHKSRRRRPHAEKVNNANMG